MFHRKFNLSNNNKFGFPKGKNTTDDVAEFLNNSYDSHNNREHLLAVYLYFSKVFDTVCQTICPFDM